MKELQRIWKEIENCNVNCPLRGKSPLLFRIKRRVNVMVVTEGPNYKEEPENVASLANHPTFTFLQAMFGGRFKPYKDANVYWTHLRKCFLKEEARGRTTGKERRRGQKALRICAEQFLLREIKALKPKLIVAVGDEAKRFFERYDKGLKGNLGKVAFSPKENPRNINIDGLRVEYLTLPHPSGLNRLWVSLTSRYRCARTVLEDISRRILKALC
ncbi:MAG: hypothetical protein DSO03_03240 [Hadesarchaea archaeon]|nr:MAG: hypothetical protein DSO03_03240 [Hadesarchaea archaeon]